MRKAQKIQAEEFVKLLEEVHSEIRKSLLGGDMMAAGGLLTQCQQGAIELGNLIEKTEGEGFVTVTYLEKYCEIVYGMYEELGTDSVPNAEKMYKHLRRALLTVENSVRNDIPVRKEVVFFPYKASMWDSLESVYLAAKEDPACDAYCVPIPYYDRNSDGSFGKMHYEGAEYPKNIEIRDWQTYRLEERRPDAIYIHNPYDEYNYVTSVHPRFYSSNLKKYTDELVYIPYFVLPEIDPQDENMVEKIKHFCLQPGVLNADKVILQSEAMSQIYMNEYIKAAQKNGVSVDRELLKKKYLGIGSPKLDKVKNTKKEEIEIPKEWQKLIQKADGSLKKIVFYNTSINALLVCGNAMLEKMKWVFSVFQKNQEEITLLWRPHPLIRATIESMRPDLWKEYEQMVIDYRSAGWGIYDDTADLNRAIALSDAYYGDYSSVIQLCQEAGMPVMIQDVEYIKEKNKNIWSRLLLDGGIYYDGRIWCTHTVENALYSIDANSAQISYEETLGDMSQIRRKYFGVEKIEDTLYFAPGMSPYIASYCITNKEKNYYWCQKESTQGYYSPMVKYGNYIYLFPVRERDIMKFNFRKGTVAYITLSNIEKDKEEQFREKGYFTRRFVVIQNKVIIPCAYENKICIFDLKTEKYFWKKYSNVQGGFLDIVIKKNDIFLLSQSMIVYKIGISLENELQEVAQLEGKYRFILVSKDNLILVPALDNAFVFLTDKGDIKKYVTYPKECYFEEELKEKMNNYTDVVQEKNRVYLIPKISNMFCIIHLDTEEIIFKYWKLTKETEEHVKKIVKAKAALTNEKNISLGMYINII